MSTLLRVVVVSFSWKLLSLNKIRFKNCYPLHDSKHFRDLRDIYIRLHIELKHFKFRTTKSALLIFTVFVFVLKLRNIIHYLLLLSLLHNLLHYLHASYSYNKYCNLLHIYYKMYEYMLVES